MSREVTSRLESILSEIVEIAGTKETSTIVPNVEVINSAPADLPAEYILIKDESGYYVPAIIVPGLSVSNGDFVNLIRIKGTEPIAFQHGSSSSAVAGGAWPPPGKVRIGSTEYDTIVAAHAAASAGDVIKVGEGTWNENLVLTKQVYLVGIDPISTIISQSSALITVDCQEDNIYLINIGVANTYDTASTITGIKITGSIVELHNVEVLTSNPTGGSNSVELDATSTYAELTARHCDIRNSGGGTNYTIFVSDDTNTVLVDLRDGVYSGVTNVLQGGTSPDTEIYLAFPIFVNGGIGTTGDVFGQYLDSNSVIRYVNNVEPFVGDVPVWSGSYWYPEPQSEGWPFSKVITVDQTDLDADHPTIAAALAAAIAGDIILIGAGTYTETLTLNKNVTLRGVARDDVIITGSGISVVTVALAGAVIEDLTITSTFNNAVSSVQGLITTRACIIRNVKVDMTGVVAALNAYAIRVSDPSAVLDRCECYGSSVATVSSRALYDTSNGTTVVVGGKYDHVGGGGGTDEDINQTNGTMQLFGPELSNNVFTLTSGIVTGEYFDGNGVKRYINNVEPFVGDVPVWSGSYWYPDTLPSVPSGTDPVGHDHSKLYESDGDGPAVTVDTDGDVLLADGVFSAKAFAFIVKNTSGVTTTLGDIGYIDNAGEYKETTTANSNLPWCVVLVGGVNNADIYVSRRGRVVVTLNANCSVGDYLLTSTTAGQASVSTTPRPEIFAVALTANGAGAGGTCEALLLCGREFVPHVESTLVYNLVNSNTTFWTGTITGVAGAVLTVTTATGNLNAVKPWTGAEVGKVILYRTGGAGTTPSALIQSVNVGANTITVDSAGDWANTTTVSVASAVVSGGGLFFQDIDLSGFLPPNATAMLMSMIVNDTGGVGSFYAHPYEVYAGSKWANVQSPAANLSDSIYPALSVINQILAVAGVATGVSTLICQIAVFGYWEAVP